MSCSVVFDAPSKSEFSSLRQSIEKATSHLNSEIVRSFEQIVAWHIPTLHRT